MSIIRFLSFLTTIRLPKVCCSQYFTNSNASSYLLIDSPAHWSDELCDRFEKLSHTGDWTVLMGVVISWKAKEGEMTDLPIIKLVDTTTDLVRYYHYLGLFRLFYNLKPVDVFLFNIMWLVVFKASCL